MKLNDKQRKQIKHLIAPFAKARDNLVSTINDAFIASVAEALEAFSCLGLCAPEINLEDEATWIEIDKILSECGFPSTSETPRSLHTQDNLRMKNIPPTPFGDALSDCDWGKIAMEAIDVETVGIKTPVINITKDYKEFGLVDGRDGKQNNLWWTLIGFALGQGTLPRGVSNKKTVSMLRKHLKIFFGIDENPIYPYSHLEDGKQIKDYTTKFSLIALDELRGEISQFHCEDFGFKKSVFNLLPSLRLGA